MITRQGTQPIGLEPNWKSLGLEGKDAEQVETKFPNAKCFGINCEIRSNEKTFFISALN